MDPGVPFRNPDIVLVIDEPEEEAHDNFKNPPDIDANNMLTRVVKFRSVTRIFITDLLNQGKTEKQILEILKEERNSNFGTCLNYINHKAELTYLDTFKNKYFKAEIKILLKGCTTTTQFCNVVKFNVEMYKAELEEAYKNLPSYIS